MSESRTIKNALISVFHKDGLGPIVERLNELGVTIYSTGGTQAFIEDLNIPVMRVEDLTGYPSILGGRVKTLHPKVFGGILNRRDNNEDQSQIGDYEIPSLDLVIVDLYPFEDTVASGADHSAIIEKIDIGGISLIRAAAKNFKDVAIVSSRDQYGYILDALSEGASTSLDQRRKLAGEAFQISSHYDHHIYNYFEGDEATTFKASVSPKRELRYGENPHQQGSFFGDFDALFDKLHGKALSYNNLLDVDAAVHLIADFDPSQGATFAILKHNNACGLATRDTLEEAYKAALAGDPVSAFGGILICNQPMDAATANEVHSLFCEVVIAPSFSDESLEILKGKKNRILLIQKPVDLPAKQYRTILNGVLVQDRDQITDVQSNFDCRTKSSASEQQLADLEFANKLVKHTKSNTIVLAKNGQLCASGTGQTSRVDALRQAIEKASHFGFDLNGAVMASDAFFPFPDCVEIANKAGVNAVVQPGGSIKDQLSIDYCDENGVAMYFTGHRHFKH